MLENKAPSRKTGEDDNRTSHFYLAMYWAEALAQQDEDLELKEQFSPISETILSTQEEIVREFLDTQGKPVDAGGYYRPVDSMAESIMRPSATFNAIIDKL